MIPPVCGQQGTKKTPAAEKVCGKSLSVHSMPRGGKPPVVTKRYGARRRVPYSLLPWGYYNAGKGILQEEFLRKAGGGGEGDGRDESLPYKQPEGLRQICRGRRPRRPAEGSTLGGAQRAPPVCYANPLVRLFAPQGQTLLTPRFRSAQPWPLFATPQPLPTMQKIKGWSWRGCGPGMPGPYRLL